MEILNSIIEEFNIEVSHADILNRNLENSVYLGELSEPDCLQQANERLEHISRKVPDILTISTLTVESSIQFSIINQSAVLIQQYLPDVSLEDLIIFVFAIARVYTNITPQETVISYLQNYEDAVAKYKKNRNAWDKFVQFLGSILIGPQLSANEYIGKKQMELDPKRKPFASFVDEGAADVINWTKLDNAYLFARLLKEEES